jgi:hypothetical protein
MVQQVLVQPGQMLAQIATMNASLTRIAERLDRIAGPAA